MMGYFRIYFGFLIEYESVKRYRQEQDHKNNSAVGVPILSIDNGHLSFKVRPATMDKIQGSSIR